VIFEFPSSVLAELVDSALGGEKLSPPSFWSPEVLAFALLRLQPTLSGEDVAPLVRYLGANAAAPWDRRAYSVARSLADVFDRYLLYRPDYVHAFEKGELPPSLVNDADARLEASLFRSLAALAKEPHFAARTAELERCAAPLASLPERLHFFGLSSLPPAHMRVIAALARFIGVDLYVMCPSDRYWGDLRTARELHSDLRKEGREAIADAIVEHVERQSPLLTTLGRTSRDFQLVLEALPGGYEDVELFGDPRESARLEERSPSLLEELQADVLELVSKTELREHPERAAARVVAGGDDSLRVHACAGPARQVEALRDDLLGLFEDYPELEPRDVLVMTPDVEAYASIVTAVFDGDGQGGRPRIRVQVSDRSLAAENPVADALLRVLDLASGRLA
ncbi:MAG: exodeoxyribonuclease V subunit gamma, partial [Polyangiaceae bacterium]|nr:exodeoxyribonuclease V subunit gamma [Polyangiaceae bacterium]